MNLLTTTLDQVFMYITSKCGASCITCYLGDDYRNIGDVPFDIISQRLHGYWSQGVKRVTLLGGEATMHTQFQDVVKKAKSIGYEYIRVTTNGMFMRELLDSEAIRQVDTWAFSIDGDTPELNATIRPQTDLNTILSNMNYAADKGFDVRVNTTITNQNIGHIIKIIKMAENNNASQVNLNLVFMKGNAKSNDKLAVNPEDWEKAYSDINEYSKNCSIQIKVPLGYHKKNIRIDDEDVRRKIHSKIYCLMDGTEYACLLNLGEVLLSGRWCDSDLPNCGQLRSAGEYIPLCLDKKLRLGRNIR
jgi:MoaA/NifB/PqqE/SkfB family radical SAM enzyme